MFQILGAPQHNACVRRPVGEQAANLLLDRLGGNREAPPRRLVLQGRLMIRNSCRPHRELVRSVNA